MFINTSLNKKQIGEKLSIDPSTIRRILIRNNVSIIKLEKLKNSKVKKSKRKLDGLRYRKYNVNDNYFETINSHEKAYILGFLYADGYLVKESVSTKRIGIDLIDKDILIKISKAMDFEGNIIELKGKRSGYNSEKTLYRLKITTPKMYDDLIKLGCLEHKTNKIKFPTEEIVPQCFINSFILGYFDGDGSITYHQRKTNWTKEFHISFTGTENFLNGILKQLELEYLKKDKRWKNKKDNITSIQISGNNQVYKILTWLYSNSSIYLYRKYEKYKQLEEQISRVK